MPPPDFIRLINNLPREAHFNSPQAGDEQIQANVAARLIQAARPDSYHLQPQASAQMQNRAERNFNNNRNLWNQFLNEYHQSQNNTEEGLTSHKMAVLLTWLQTSEAFSSHANSENLAGRLTAFNHEIETFLRDIESNGPLSPAQKCERINSFALNYCIHLLDALRTSQTPPSEALRAAIRELKLELQHGYELMVRLIPANHALSYLRHFAEGQAGIFQAAFDERMQTLPHFRHIQQELNLALSQAQAIQHNPQASALEKSFAPLVEQSVPEQAQGLPIPSEAQIAQSIIHSHTLIMATTLMQEVDFSHRENEALSRERYSRFHQVMEALMAENPNQNIRQTMNQLRTLRWDDVLYNSLGSAHLSIDAAIEAFRHPQGSNLALRNQVNEIIADINLFRSPALSTPTIGTYRVQNITHALEVPPAINPQNIVQLLEGSRLLHRLLPSLLEGLLQNLEHMPENDPDRRSILRYFESRNPESENNAELAAFKRELLFCLLRREDPTPRLLSHFNSHGENAHQFVQGLIGLLRNLHERQAPSAEALAQIGQLRDPETRGLLGAVVENFVQHPSRAEIPPWLSSLVSANYSQSERNVLEEVKTELRQLLLALREGGNFNGSDFFGDYNRTYSNLEALISNARDLDLPHIDRLLHDEGLFDDDHHLIEEMLDLDASALSNEENSNQSVSHWANQVLHTIDAHEHNFWEHFIGDNEEHPESFRVIRQMIAGRGEGSISQPLQSITGEGLSDATRSIAQTAMDHTRSLAFRSLTALEAFATLENAAFTGVMIQRSRAATNAITSAEVVARGARVGISEYLQARALQLASRSRFYFWTPLLARGVRLAVENPANTAVFVSGSVAASIALSNEQRALSEGRDINLYEDMLRYFVLSMAATSPWYAGSWYRSIRGMRFFSIASRPLPLRMLAAGVGSGLFGALYAGYHILEHPPSPLESLDHRRNFWKGFGAGMVFFAPLYVPDLAMLIPGMESMSRSSSFQRLRSGGNAWIEGLTSVSQNGQLGIMGHSMVALETGLETGALASGLQFARDARSGYDTHFVHDVASSTLTLALGLGASSLLGLGLRILPRNRAFNSALTENAPLALEASVGRNLGEGALRWLTATMGMYLGNAESRALGGHRALPNRSDFESPEALAVTALDMLAFEVMNGALHRRSLRQSIGRARATEIDFMVNRLMAQTNYPRAEESSYRDLLWARLALHFEHSRLSDSEVLQHWQAHFTPRAGIELRRRNRAYGLDQTLQASLDELGNQAAAQMVRRGSRDPLPLTYYLDNGVLRSERAPGNNALIPLEIGFSRQRVFISESTRQRMQTEIQNFERQGRPQDSQNLRNILSLHGETVPIPPIAQEIADIIHGQQELRNPHETRIYIVRSHLGANEALTREQMLRRLQELGRQDLENTAAGSEYKRLLDLHQRMEQGLLLGRVRSSSGNQEGYDIYFANTENIPQTRRGHILAEIMIPGTQTRETSPRPIYELSPPTAAERTIPWLNRGRNAWNRSRNYVNRFRAPIAGAQIPMSAYVRGEQGLLNGLPLDLQTALRGLQLFEGIRPTFSLQLPTGEIQASMDAMHVNDSRVILPADLGRILEGRLPTGLRFILNQTSQGFRLLNQSENNIAFSVDGQPLRLQGEAVLNPNSVLELTSAEGDPIRLHFSFRVPGTNVSAPTSSDISNLISPVPPHFTPLNRFEAPILGTGSNSEAGPRRAEANVCFDGFGEASAHTSEGIDKHHLQEPRRYPHPINEDAFGIGTDSQGRPLLMVADGMGGHGNGDVASARAIESVLETLANEEVNLGEAFIRAHGAVRSAADGGATVASAVRIHPDGRVEAALAGDARLWLLRVQGNNSYQVIEPHIPDSQAGLNRATTENIPGYVAPRNTLEMNADSGNSRVLSGLGNKNSPIIVESWNRSIFTRLFSLEGNQILYEASLTLPGESPSDPRIPLVLRPGDSLALFSDGLGDLVDENQLADSIRGVQGAENLRRAMVSRANQGFDTYRWRQEQQASGRLQIPAGRGLAFEGNFMDESGHVYNHLEPSEVEMENLIGNCGPDNIVLLVYTHRGNGR